MTRPNEDAHKELFDAGMAVRRKVMVCLDILEIYRALTSAQGDAFIDNMIKQVCILNYTYVHLRYVIDLSTGRIRLYETHAAISDRGASS